MLEKAQASLKIPIILRVHLELRFVIENKNFSGLWSVLLENVFRIYNIWS